VPRIYDTNTAARHGRDGLQISGGDKPHGSEATTTACQQCAGAQVAVWTVWMGAEGHGGRAQRVMATERHVGGGLRLAPRSAAIGEDALAWRGAVVEQVLARMQDGRRWRRVSDVDRPPLVIGHLAPALGQVRQSDWTAALQTQTQTSVLCLHDRVGARSIGGD
jgi:hypothetical protein